MGMRLRAYTAADLRSISLPGRTLPALFWAVPLAPWKEDDLEQHWHAFTNGESALKRLGLFLAPATSGDTEGQSPLRAGASRLGAVVSEVVPTEYVTGRLAGESQPYPLLLLSGAYPEPGWGVAIGPNQVDLARPARLDVAQVSELIDAAVKRLPPEARDRFSLFERAGAAQEQYQEAERCTEVAAPESLPRDLDSHTEAVKAVRKAASARDVAAAWQLLPALRLITPPPGGPPKKLKQSDAARWVELLARLLAGEPPASRAVDGVLNGLRVTPEQRAEMAPDPRGWADEQKAQRCDDLFAAADEELAWIERLVGAHVLKRQALKTQISAARTQLRPALSSYAAALAEALAFTRQVGPQLLEAFIAAARDVNLRTCVVPWDPARLVGSRVGLRTPMNRAMLHDAAYELAGLGRENLPGAPPPGGRGRAERDGVRRLPELPPDLLSEHTSLDARCQVARHDGWSDRRAQTRDRFGAG